MVNPVIEVDERVAKMLHDILEQACWDLGKINENSQPNIKRVDSVRMIGLGEGYHNVSFIVRIKRSSDMELACYG